MAPAIRLIVSDIDGVWTDGRIIYSDAAHETKEFNVRDGLAVRLAQRAGLEVAVITSRRSQAVERRCRELGIEHVSQAHGDKLQELRRIASQLTIGLDEVCYIGDDLPDLAPIHAAGMSAAPSDAVAEVRGVVSLVLRSRGGDGAFRELVEHLLRVQGLWDTVLATFDTPNPPAGV